jgi:hypothetical protein
MIVMRLRYCLYRGKPHLYIEHYIWCHMPAKLAKQRILGNHAKQVKNSKAFFVDSKSDGLIEIFGAFQSRIFV